MHISNMLAEAERSSAPSFSFEFFPPKTAQGVQNLYDRMDRMHAWGPSFIDITWGAGGRLAQLTSEMVSVAQAQGFETCMHLTCTDMGLEKVNEALRNAYTAGCTNILALRGDPPREKESWEATEDGFTYAKDLVSHIRKTYGDHFDVGVAGYPEGCDDQDDLDLLMEHLKQKVDAGASFIVTQMFYDVDNFLSWVDRVRAIGVTVPIIPGIMPISTHASFLRRCKHMNASIPPKWTVALEEVKNDDATVRTVGKKLVGEMCRRILASGKIHHLHFYTMNLQQATRMVLDEVKILQPYRKPLPWTPSKAQGRREEDVRPIFWKNRNKSYVARTADWDEFPNGRWGDSRSPAFGAHDAYDIGLKGTNEQNRKLWGEPACVRDVANIFVKYLAQEVDSLPWSEAPITSEAEVIKADLVNLNQRGFLTVNSQPAVAGALSTDPVYGWGPRNGFVYQKAYLEFLVAPELIDELVQRIEANPELTYYSVRKDGHLRTNAPGDGPNAVTWGVFPGKEIVQPTIVELISFLAWKDEAFRLGTDWAHCYALNSPSRRVIETMMQTWYLVNIVHNDFHQSRAIFSVFDGLSLDGMDVIPAVPHEHNTNGTGDHADHATSNKHEVGGPHKVTNGQEPPRLNGHTNGIDHGYSHGVQAA